MNYRQRMFVAYYLGESAGNATDAARRAGYGSAHVTGCRLLKNAKIRAAIESKVASVAMSQDEILARLSEIAAADLTEFVEVDATGRLSLRLRKGRGHLLKKLKRTQAGELSIELESKIAALTKLGEYHALWQREIAELGEQVAELRRLLDEKSAGGTGT